MAQHSFSLTDFYVTDLKFECPLPSSDFKKGLLFNFEHQIHCNLNEDLHKFSIIYFLTLFNEEKTFKIQLKAFAAFTYTTPVTRDFLHTSIITDNCSAIGFPYVRSFVTNILTISGYQPIYLPAINFISTRPKKITFIDDVPQQPKKITRFQKNIK